MADIFDSKKRSKIMSKIGPIDSKPELLVRKHLHKKGFRFRKNDKRYPGKPDIVLPKYNTVIFVNGCFWHGHDCQFAKLPESNTVFWSTKISANLDRDKKNIRQLKKLGWNVLIVWQCEIKNKKLRKKKLTELVLTLNELS